MWDACLVLPPRPAALVCRVSQWALVSFRFPTDRGSTRSTWKARLVPLRFYWSTKTHPVPPRLCCQFLLQMKSSKASQHQHWRRPLSPLFPRSAHLSSFLVLFPNWLLPHVDLRCRVPPPSPFTFQVLKSAAAASVKPAPVAAAIPTVPSTGRDRWTYGSS